MRRSIQVCLGELEAPVAVIHFDKQGARQSSAFEYSSAWLGSAERFALAPSLPLVRGPQFHKKLNEGSVFHSIVADTEPDGWGRKVIQRDHAKRRRAPRGLGKETLPEELNSLDYLLSVDDFGRLGALRFKDETGEFQRSPQPGHRRTPPLLELGALVRASHALEKNSETAKDLAFLRGQGTSLGGLRPKCSVLDEQGRLCIGKFPSVSDERDVTHAEVLALKLARRAGIDSAHAELIDTEHGPVALVRRFDRHATGRLLYASSATLLGIDPRSGDTGTYTQIADLLRQYGARVQQDLEELFRRIAFSILITNVDDHLLNHGFLHVTRGQWVLSPAFDINPFPERTRELKTWISEECGPEASVDALMSVSAYFKIDKAKARDLVKKVEKAVSTWRTVGRSLGMSDASLEMFADAFEHAERRKARAL
jgi:serine/threonine-protein kinase HipA